MKTVLSFEGGSNWHTAAQKGYGALELSKPQVDSPGKPSVACPAWRV